jgi:uncharacterized protein with NAD-binding domain and iron-sulfur cluster
VIIVGAGIAGLAAAKTLVENGVKDIIILEGKQVVKCDSGINGDAILVEHDADWDCTDGTGSTLL